MKTALYRHFDKCGNLLYVGISLSAHGRLSSHMRAAKWAKDICNVTIEWFDTRIGAIDAEKIAIITERPAHNIIHSKCKIAETGDAHVIRAIDVLNAVASLVKDSAHEGASRAVVDSHLISLGFDKGWHDFRFAMNLSAWNKLVRKSAGSVVVCGSSGRETIFHWDAYFKKA